MKIRNRRDNNGSYRGDGEGPNYSEASSIQNASRTSPADVSLSPDIVFAESPAEEWITAKITALYDTQIVLLLQSGQAGRHDRRKGLDGSGECHPVPRFCMLPHGNRCGRKSGWGLFQSTMIQRPSTRPDDENFFDPFRNNSRKPSSCTDCAEGIERCERLSKSVKTSRNVTSN
jgi:hypothetical protein